MIDIHTHLNTDAFPDREEAIARAKASGVRAFVLVGYDLPTSEKALQLARKENTLYACCGIHPHDARMTDAAVLKRVETLCSHPKVIAVGETGLDFYRNLSPKEKQIEVFLQQKALALRLGLPLMIHCRDAYDEILPLLRDAPPFVMHCFQGEKEKLSDFLDAGGYLSFAGPLTYPKNSALRKTAEACPLDRLFLETDAPYLPPQPYRGKRNEPSYLPLVAECLCQIKKMKCTLLVKQLRKNFSALFQRELPEEGEAKPEESISSPQ